MGGHPAGITVDAVREQLAALGHDDVSDDVIASFLDSLMAHQVNVVNVAPVENVAAANGADDDAAAAGREDRRADARPLARGYRRAHARRYREGAVPDEPRARRNARRFTEISNDPE